MNLCVQHATASVFLGTSLSLWAGIGWKLVNATIRQQFGDVPRITTSELAGKLAGPHPPLLLDVRTNPEFEVSHLSGATRIDPRAEAGQVMVARDREIVTYCSVGYRSARLAQRMRAAGFTHVSNLEGSIFQWANEKRSLVDGASRPTNQVHPYDERWGKLLAPEYRAPVP